MDKDKLKKEAGESWWNDNNCSGALSTKKIYICGYLAGAERYGMITFHEWDKKFYFEREIK